MDAKNWKSFELLLQYDIFLYVRFRLLCLGCRMGKELYLYMVMVEERVGFEFLSCIAAGEDRWGFHYY